ncbi:MAG: SURF1 family protein [Paracoccus sp. (in: a-proteobacteria)]|uniref:SURF1 family protein n=1 Tax=Paracoccus sp. TaxID=267 RepID=UPI0039E39059
MTAGATRRSRLARNLMALAALAGVVLFCGLGIWQVQRLQWKLDLIARVEARLSAPPVAAPGPGDWAALSEQADEYRRVALRGSYDYSAETLVQAVTERGAGFWVMTPLAADQGFTVWINRGFIPGERRAPEDWLRPEGMQQVTGLLRASQPHGAFLRKNDPLADRWYSRDVQALSQRQGLAGTAPYFIDADAGPDASALPMGGLTVVSFRNSHLSYALTWFALAIGLAVAGWYVLFRAEPPRD